jgi:hypothetical protein
MQAFRQPEGIREAQTHLIMQFAILNPFLITLAVSVTML